MSKFLDGNGLRYLWGKIRAAVELKQDRLSGSAGQIVGFDASGSAVAQDAPVAGVASFNGRTGVVAPQSGDYTAAQVGARPSTWTPTAEDVGASPLGHTHSKSEITDFPTSMPASDVSGWAKAASKPSYTASEVGARASTWTPTAADVGAATMAQVNSAIETAITGAISASY